MEFRDLLGRTGISATALAEELGVNKVTVFSWLRGDHTPYLSSAQLKRLLCLLNCPIKELSSCFPATDEPFLTPTQYLKLMVATGTGIDDLARAFSSEIPRESHPVLKTRKRVAKTRVTKPSVSSAKRYVIATPDGTIEEVTNLAAYCREHNLYSSMMLRVAKGTQDSYKGYRCYRLEPDRIYTIAELLCILENDGKLFPTAQQVAS